MRTNIEIDDQLMADAMKAGGYATKKETVEEGLRLLAQHENLNALRKLRGKISWTGNLSEMRQDRADYDVLWNQKTAKVAKKKVAKKKSA